MTNMNAGLSRGKNQLVGLSSDLAKVMVVVSDGIYNEGGDPEPVAREAKDAGITIFAIGFKGAHLDSMKQIAGNKNNDCGDACVKKVDKLEDLKTYVETQFCKTITTIVPPTPAPTPACGSNRAANMDDPWATCIGGLCNMYLGNGSSKGCLHYSNLGQCSEDFMQRNCHCTCGRCCDLTPEPTPAPTDTDQPTATPTAAPTFPDCTPNFDLTFDSPSAWLTGEETLRDFFNQYGYNYDVDWKMLVNQFRVKVIRNGDVFRFDSPEGILKYPFETFQMTICMPDDFPRKGGLVNSAQSFQHMAWLLLTGLMLQLARGHA
jgi:hypothetical protein